MKIERIYASSVAKLDSNVYTGGGTDDTVALQAVLDKAKDEQVGVYLIMDGAALVSHLDLYSNTTIECLNKDCGFFQKAQSNNSVVGSANQDRYSLNVRNITLLGGTYNQDCLNQEHDIPSDEIFVASARGGYQAKYRKFMFGMEFYGIENLLVRDVTIRNFRTYAFAVGGFRNVTIENVWLDLPDHRDGQNQDGFHFWGPGRFLTVRNVGGRVGDDFMNLGPDERDKISSITDVLIDGVFLDYADQSIRMLTRDKGRLDRVTVRNVSGTYRSYGFYINPWFADDCVGNFGNIFIENVDLQALVPNYNYRPACLFSAGGNIESLTMKNIRHHNSCDNRQLFELGVPFCGDPNRDHEGLAFGVKQKIPHIAIEDLTIIEQENDPDDTEYIGVYAEIDNLVLRNITVLKNQPEENGCLLNFGEHGRVNTLITNQIHTKGLKAVISEPEKIGEHLK